LDFLGFKLVVAFDRLRLLGGLGLHCKITFQRGGSGLKSRYETGATPPTEIVPVKIEFVFIAESGVLERQCLLLCESIREFGGRYAGAEITVLHRRAARGASARAGGCGSMRWGRGWWKCPWCRPARSMCTYYVLMDGAA
jgi:hypothetical protein